ncbi:MAG: hypothetical protein HZC28_10915 [Spirochaetes bacterium]|nr:hypothetical protein [Spirochaetota bacterium]
MKKTEKLKVSFGKDVRANHLVIHPNDGFDLGMMTKEHPVSLCTEIPLEHFLSGAEGHAVPARVELRNECPSRTLQINAKTWEKIGKPDSAVVLYDGSRIFLCPVTK